MALEVRVETVWVGKWGLVKTVIVRQAKKLEDLAVQYFIEFAALISTGMSVFPGHPMAAASTPTMQPSGWRARPGGWPSRSTSSSRL